MNVAAPKKQCATPYGAAATKDKQKQKKHQEQGIAMGIPLEKTMGFRSNQETNEIEAVLLVQLGSAAGRRTPANGCNWIEQKPLHPTELSNHSK